MTPFPRPVNHPIWVRGPREIPQIRIGMIFMTLLLVGFPGFSRFQHELAHVMIYVGGFACDCGDKSLHCPHWATQTTLLVSNLWAARFDLPPTLGRMLLMLPGLLDRLPLSVYVCKESLSVSFPPAYSLVLSKYLSNRLTKGFRIVFYMLWVDSKDFSNFGGVWPVSFGLTPFPALLRWD